MKIVYIIIYLFYFPFKKGAITMKKIIFKGCGTAIITPFTENGVNFDEFGKIIEEQIKNKIDAIIVCGTTGEASTMTEEERKETITYALKKANLKLLKEKGKKAYDLTIHETMFLSHISHPHIIKYYKHLWEPLGDLFSHCIHRGRDEHE